MNRAADQTNGLGVGYPLMVAAAISAAYPDMNIRFLNRAVGGDAIADLVERWDEDCIALKPTVVSILVGVNDTWNHVGKESFEPASSFKENTGRFSEKRKRNLTQESSSWSPMSFHFRKTGKPGEPIWIRKSMQ